MCTGQQGSNNIARELSLCRMNKETEIAKLIINSVMSTIKCYWLLVISVTHYVLHMAKLI